ncbi:hypothetical protein [Streptomyces sp. NPDC055400]
MNVTLTKKSGKGPRMQTAAIGAVCAAMLAGGVGVAIAGPVSTPAVHAATVAATAPATSITAHANHTSVKAGSSVTITGKVTTIKSAATSTAAASGPLSAPAPRSRSSGAYSVHVKLSTKGAEQLRVAHGKTMSPIVHVTVT